MVKNNIKKIIQDYAFSICEYLKVPIQEMFVYKKAE